MNRKKLDDRIKKTIEAGVNNGHRSLVILLGSKGRDQVVILHQMLSQSQVRARPTVLWCYKSRDTLGFSTHRQKRMKQLKKKQKVGEAADVDDPFDLFISATNIRWCYYNETTKILGQTFGMVVLQDFEAINPNLLARTIETVEGGGMVILLLSTLESLQGLHDLTMDAHEKYRTSAHQNVVSRFNRRFILSLSECSACLTLDDKLNVISSIAHSPDLVSEARSNSDSQLKTLITSLVDTQPAHALVSCCKTLEQAKAVLQFLQVLADRTSVRSTVALTAARGRGKSAALGLAIAASIGLGYSSVTVTSPAPENLTTCFEFVLKGLSAMHYEQHTDFDIVYAQGTIGRYISRISIFKDHRQSIRYVSPTDSNGSAELVVIDEAAAIPLPTVKKLLGPHLTFMASTVHGYEGTGRALSLKLIRQLRSGDAPLYELNLTESIRYKPDDPVEAWLNKLLCLDVDLETVSQDSCPDPKECQLYHIDRDSLFSMHPLSEKFLRQLMALYTASHYKNSPNDLQMMCDAPAHSLFCLLGPRSSKDNKLPRVVTFIQVCLEGEIAKSTVEESLGRGRRAAGDLIPWTISQQFNDSAFASLSGARIIRIATDPGMQAMGYGSVAVNLLLEYYSGLVPFESESDEQALLSPLSERKAEKLHYIGTSFGLTPELFKFWNKLQFAPVYIRQTTNEATGEHSAILLKTIKPADWLAEFTVDFQKRFINLLAFQFRSFPASLALDIVNACNRFKVTNETSSILTLEQLRCHMSPHDVQRLLLYSRSLVDYHLVTDLMPVMARLLFTGKLGSISLSALQSALILSVGLQCKLFDQLSLEIGMEVSQMLGLFNRAIKKITTVIESIEEKAIENTIEPPPENLINNKMKPLAEELEKELEKEAAKIKNEDRIARTLIMKPKHMFKVKSIHPGKNKKWTEKQGNKRKLK